LVSARLTGHVIAAEVFLDACATLRTLLNVAAARPLGVLLVDHFVASLALVPLY
jgi:hypothetical protein